MLALLCSAMTSRNNVILVQKKYALHTQCKLCVRERESEWESEIGDSLTPFVKLCLTETFEITLQVI